jgi:hypothetical protein
MSSEQFEYKVFRVEDESFFSGTYWGAIERFMNNPEKYDGWEFVQVVDVWIGGASILFKRGRK